MNIVNISEYKISNEVDELITYSLGSCLGITVYDPVLHMGGMIHCMLPMSSINKEKAKESPAMFVDTGLPAMFNKMLELGSNKNHWIIKAAGCAEFMDPNHHFNIGERNIIILKKVLWKNRLLLDNSDLGGKISRTLKLDLVTGTVSISSGGRFWEI